jgi:hypothetical protein
MPSKTTSPIPKHDPTPAFARQVLELYADALREVRFPDLDLALLEAARDALLVSQLEVERSEAQLQAARAALDAKSEALQTKAERALAYARVFALGDPALSAQLAEIGVRKKPLALVEGGTAPVKRRGRSKKTAEETELFVAEGSALDEPAAEGGEASSVPASVERRRGDSVAGESR